VPSAKRIRGRILRVDTPEWEPLLNLAPNEVTNFMWMHEIELEDGTRLHAYKHCETRRYLHLDHGGRAFVSVESHDLSGASVYEEARPRWALDFALAKPDESAKIFRQNLSAEFKRIRWARSATRHRISKKRIRHVLQHCLVILEEDPPTGGPEARDGRLVFLGSDPAGAPTEVIAVETDDANLMVIHAMRLGARYRGIYNEVRTCNR
jgi:hypothetical protein